ncbi:MAG TPA: flagellar hook capping FlgD N-terminal domain-containing protein [Terracidiphilus sp.]|nr:flagellar hook capping FlgD N-terminal domain-containing protein [Terracidiphilus sp.]
MTPAIDQAYRAIPPAGIQQRARGLAANSLGEKNTAADNSGSITANDFLTLLVTEMKNQDPTANTDPNEYINQLVQVNSLQQLIAINETLKNSLPTNVKGNADPSSNSVSVTRLPITANELTDPRPVTPTVKNAVAENANTSSGSFAASRVATALSHN